MIPNHLKRNLLNGELADLALYVSLRKNADGALATTLDHFIATEKRHVAFWQKTFDLHTTSPSFSGLFRNFLIRVAILFGGQRLTYLMLESVETHGVQKYLDLWQRVEDPVVRDGLRTILTEELLHEDEAATNGDRSIRPDHIRNAFLGFNDGSVEILGAVNGLVAALHDPRLVAISALTVSFAGAISMAAGAFLSTHSEHELERMEAMKRAFLDKVPFEDVTKNSPLRAALLVGTSYLIGAAMPVLPFLFGAANAYISILLSGSLILIVAAILSFLSGMSLQRRMLLNGLIIILAVLASYGLGLLVQTLFGVSAV